MAVETEVDSLVLDIKVNDNSNGETSAKKISTLDRVLTKFERTIKNLDAKSFKTKFSALTTAIRPFAKELKNIKGELTALDRILKKTSLTNVKDAVSGNAKVGETTTKTGENTDGVMPSAQSGDAPKIKGDAGAEQETLKSLISKYGELTKTVDTADGKRTLFFERFNGSDKITTKFTADLENLNGKTKEVLNLSTVCDIVLVTEDTISVALLKSSFLKESLRAINLIYLRQCCNQ